MSKSELLKISE